MPKKLIVDPRNGDIEDDACSLKRHSLISLAGNMLAEISVTKLLIAWFMLLALPSLALGLVPILTIAWANSVAVKISAPLIGISSAVLLAIIGLIGWFGGRTLFRLAESSFWALNSIVIGPTYMVARETLRHVGDRLLPESATQARHDRLRSIMAVVAGLVVCGIALTIAVLAWRRSFWAATFSDFTSMRVVATAAVANSLVLVSGYLALASLVWCIADATLPQPADLRRFSSGAPGARQWRVAHLSDLHIVGERYGFRIECGRAGPCGNERVEEILSQLERIDAHNRLDAIVISGDVTDTGRSGEWAEVIEALDRRPRLTGRVLLIPGNHDLNIADRGNPARIDLPTSPNRRLRQMRALSITSAVQGDRARLVNRETRTIGTSLADALAPYEGRIARFSDAARPRLSKSWLEIWARAFPMVVPPDGEDGLGFVLLNSNADTHFSFSNALGMVSHDQADAIEIATASYPRASWVIALHHHLLEYPWRANNLSERVGTALINGNWFVRRLVRLADRAVVLHGHRHVDWIGECANLLIISAPSPVMDPHPSCFYVHTLVKEPDGRLGILRPERVDLTVPFKPLA